MANDANFYQHVFEVVRQIPPGRVTSYGAIAKFLGAPTWSRKVGHAMGQLPTEGEPVPFQRVVSGSGHLSGSTDNIEYRISLLEKEGISFVGNKIQNFKAVNWDPSIELDY
ncbi:MGMT family protein [Mucilaginibacter daejeonensis]|uniref:MGMT family protein n=1 Tax=Mucilaginibacter daejeonensis TaxID=398049 RepID=UPI001D179929|nr:MGMT family protein [Mucilaginibacter daejeonensis]UEG53773.1 MGMT family protein [Mucilaginibacter daejeonensis]